MVNHNATQSSAFAREIGLITSQSAPPSCLDVQTTAAPQPGQVRLLLAQLLQTDVIGQLVQSNKCVLPGSDGAQPLGPTRPSLADQLRFRTLLLDGDVFDCTSFLGDLRYQGASVQDIYLDLFAPVARAIGCQWENDTLTFLDVTKASSRLQSLVHTISAAPQENRLPNDSHRIILAIAPGEQHTLGMLIVSRLFEMAGWDVIDGPDVCVGNEMNELVNKQWVGVIGLSASTPDRARNLKDVILELRQSSLNRDVSILVGGNGFSRHPEIAEEIGADGLAKDGRDAVSKAETMLQRGLPQKTT
jgi:methanogenic corrinoid protein MtbC1